eukprot:TRINITY_DN11499_c0_g3_i3.p1 TRINITY_DN11499_c0_g3~~TRINITY_DN11499_c0_g3_i3.p1  ORF type:complete len:400 (-),score=100.83 TRINITY_DN11499_c0_g3_i3:65-1264(-)
MKFQLQALAICLVVLSVSAKHWSDPIKLEESSNSSIGLNLFMPNANQSFILYSRPEPNNKTQELMIRQYDFLNKSLGNFTKLGDDRLYFGADIQGSSDAKEILIALEASRSKILESPLNGSSFYNIFLIHSSGPNATWSNESAIDEGSNSTHVARIYPKLLAVEEQGLMYLFYMNVYPNNDTALAVLKYNPEEKNLVEHEVILVNETDPLFGFSAAYTYVNESLMLHVAFAGDNSKLMYMSSVDGKNWTEPVPLANISLSSHTISLASNPGVAPSRLFLAYADADNKTYVRSSNDLGKDWGKPHKLSKNEVESLSVAVCGDEKELGAFVLYSSKGKLKLKVLEIDDEEDLDSVKAPFKGMKVGGGVIKCVKSGRYYELLAMGTDYEETVAYVSTMRLKD